MIAVAIWDSVREGIGWVLAFFYSIIPNSGVAIILLTVAVRLVLFPLTAKQAKSMIAMQRVQPEIKKLQAKYKNDRQKLNEEMMKFYKENQINPLGGCLPLLLQMPVFIALYQTLRDIPKFIPHPPARFSQMYTDICGEDHAVQVHAEHALRRDEPHHVREQGGVEGFSVVWPYLVLVGIVVVTGFIQQRQTMRNQTQPNPQMAIISKIFPVVFAFITWGLPSGVGLYFATSNLWQIGQQEVVYRTMMKPAGGSPPKKGEDDVEGSASKGGTATKTREVTDGRTSGGEKSAGAKPGQPRRRARGRWGQVGGGAKSVVGASRPAAAVPRNPPAAATGPRARRTRRRTGTGRRARQGAPGATGNGSDRWSGSRQPGGRSTRPSMPRSTSSASTPRTSRSKCWRSRRPDSSAASAAVRRGCGCA